MVDKNAVRLQAQLRLVRRMVKRGSRFVATSLTRVQVAEVLNCSTREIDRLVAVWDLRPRNGHFPVSQIRIFIDNR